MQITQKTVDGHIVAVDGLALLYNWCAVLALHFADRFSTRWHQVKLDTRCTCKHIRQPHKLTHAIIKLQMRHCCVFRTPRGGPATSEPTTCQPALLSQGCNTALLNPCTPRGVDACNSFTLPHPTPPRHTVYFLQDLPAHWEKRLSAAVKMMADKHELAHVPGHPGMFKMSKALQEKQARKKGPRKPKVGLIQC